uniref:UBC core domain-containing protein n=1 Tax=Chlamydomonas leiostraca TaxID=1034604 RepID=A0A7S0WZE1_9CHLO|mmetsp:Transcript_420/g.1108  ORF Transcript_420/g.1108 Transcript_420/m.1108 type:complete len:159 (+) Transcript_420:194-670(+)|eukprot:CAMPEP_0202870344 /NCGR_PEP_ID=MMETSP1391-20130828/15421_1 /ASSEMBLY_ACC=CAM_ASM_000867 /TAXON_ID=1034604 /ORGANISM="Chlamydomonas leiostraca, Strain SAG 11-49" /LENGTH=158 /DNA_ID=CAMNT_0049550883 /DNA_START=148 /DNA_END=624 /DNA_ORIENTATION=-
MGAESCLRTIQAQLNELLQDPPPGVNAGPTDDQDIMSWTGMLAGPPGTPYEGGVFMLDIAFPPTYPYDPPSVRFTTPIYHPNVNEKGDICLSILFQNCSWDTGWSPALTISSVLLSLLILLQEPNTDHSLRPELAQQYLQDKESYMAACREATRAHAM